MRDQAHPTGTSNGSSASWIGSSGASRLISLFLTSSALTAAGVISAYLIDVHWDKETSCLTFDEKDREDAAHAQRGRVYIPDGRQFMSLVTVEGGSIRLVTVSRPVARDDAEAVMLS